MLNEKDELAISKKVDEKLTGFEGAFKTKMATIPDEKKPDILDKGIETAREEISNRHVDAIKCTIRNDEATQKQFIDQARKTIDNGLDTLDKKSLKERQDANFSVNAEACNAYGIEKSVPLWEIRLMRWGHNFWFVIYFVVASLTIAPVNIFFKGISYFIKKTWAAVLIAVIMYTLIFIVLPAILSYYGINYWWI